MDCDRARSELSAAVDGLDRIDGDVERHLASCQACRSWQERLHALQRSQLRAADEHVALPLIDPTTPPRFQRNRWLRIGLAWAGLLLLVWSVPGIVTGGDDAAAVHLYRHQSAFSAALGLTFLVVAWRPERSYGLVPFAAIFTVALGATAVIDLLGGDSDPALEAHHAVEIAGLATLWVLGRGSGPGPRRRRRESTRKLDVVGNDG